MLESQTETNKAREKDAAVIVQIILSMIQMSVHLRTLRLLHCCLDPKVVISFMTEAPII